jgi:hypothetical protein
MEILQEIGSYAGFAAVVGLAVLSALYFSQARDVKRLREWAGRAPERGPQPAPSRGVVAQPIARPGQGVPSARPSQPATPPVPRPPGAQQPAPVPTPAQAAATGAAPAVAKGPAPATPAAASSAAAQGGDAQTDSAENGADSDVTAMDTVVHPPPRPPDDEQSDDDAKAAGEDAAAVNGGGAEEVAEDAAAAAEDGASERTAATDGDAGEGDETGEWSPEDEHSDFDLTDEHDVLPATPAATAPRPPTPPRPLPRRPVPAPRAGYGRSTIIPPYAESRPAEDDRPAGRSRRPLLFAAGALVALALAAFAVLQLTGGDDGGTNDEPAGLATPTQDGGDGAADGGGSPIDPASVTVAVLNGTTVPGLAAQIGDKVAGEGFQLGTVTNNFDQERAESVVLYTDGSEREAADVARRLDIAQREPIDPDSQSLAGDASVVVVAGADQTQ